jgi:hypothetical protein
MKTIPGIALPAGNPPVRGALNNIQTTSNQSLQSIAALPDQLVYFRAIAAWAQAACAYIEAQPAGHAAAG